MSEAYEKEKQLFVLYGSAASEAMFDYPCHFFRVPGHIGIIPYRQESKCAIVFGNPICPSEERASLAKAFYEHCKTNHLTTIYITASKEFADSSESHHCPICIEVCEEMIFDPQFNLSHMSPRLKRRLDKAIKHGLTFHEYIPFDQNIEQALIEIGAQWQKTIKGPHIYLGHLDFFNQYIGKRWFYIKEGEKITAMIMLSKLEAYEGWLLKFLVTAPGIFPETSEFLMVSVLEVLQKENCRFLSKGMMPIPSLGEIKGLGKLPSYLAKNIYTLINKACQFEKRKEYWLRYTPTAVPAYILVSKPSIGTNEIKALIKAFKTDR